MRRHPDHDDEIANASPAASPERRERAQTGTRPVDRGPHRNDQWSVVMEFERYRRECGAFVNGHGPHDAGGDDVVQPLEHGAPRN